MDQNLYEAIKGRKTYLNEKKIKFYMYQLLKSLDFMHRSGIFHRDIKPYLLLFKLCRENILLRDDHLVLADMGSCKGIYSKPPFTEYISTRWYRSPECLMTDGYYNYKMDLWGVGCVMFEISSLFPLFPGDNELDQIQKIQNILGPPSPDVFNLFKKNSTHMADITFTSKNAIGISKFLTHVSSECQDVIMKLLAYNPEERLSAKQALAHPFFKEFAEQEVKLSKMSLNGFGNPLNLMKSFHNDSLSMIKSPEETQLHIINNNPQIKTLKKDKVSFLPDIKLNIVHDSNSNLQKSKNDTEEYETEGYNNGITYVKLPKIQRNGNNECNANINAKMTTKQVHFNANSNNNVNSENNQSMEIQVNTQYSKKINPNISMSKKMNFRKKHYVSPYSQKIIFGNVKV